MMLQKKNKLRLGDLVRHSEFHKLWQAFQNEWNCEQGRDLGVVIDMNPHKCFVYWFGDGTLLAHEEEDLEVISESR